MQITVLGKSPSWQDADGACSGYLVQEGDSALLLDCGNGVFSKLRRFRDYIDIDAVLISHLHSDHFFDLVPFANALVYSPRQQRAPGGSGHAAAGRGSGEAAAGTGGGTAVRERESKQTSPASGSNPTEPPARPRLHAPPGSAGVFRSLMGCWGDPGLIERAFEVHEFDGADELILGPLVVRFCEVPHFTRTYAVEVANRSARVTYSADCGPNEELIRFGRDTDLMLIEATLASPEPAGARGHLTPREAGEHGRRAGAHRLVLTHYSDELDSEQLRAEGGDGYGGPVDLACEGSIYLVAEH